MGLMSELPVKYDKNLYTKWHNETWPDDSDIEDKLKALRDKIKEEAKDDLIVLSELLYYILPHCANEFDIMKKDFSFEMPLRNIIKNDNKNEYDILFKSTESILDKLWRKNKIDEKINLTNIKEKLTDLIRTEIICSTLEACEFVADHLKSEHIVLPKDYPLNKSYSERIEKITFEPEMKMASGYFAYHGLVFFKSGLIVEIQIYSKLMSVWRKLSHKLYSETRLKPNEKFNFATPDSRLISLGHLLHLAECEVMRLENEI